VAAHFLTQSWEHQSCGPAEADDEISPSSAKAIGIFTIYPSNPSELASHKGRWLTTMKSSRVHITGASGSGTTTLGRALADALAVSHHDTDDYFWRPTDPPYQERREREARLRLMRELFLGKASWVLSGSLIGWGDSIIPYFDLVVFLSVSTEARLERLRKREAVRFGADSVAPGAGDTKKQKTFSNGLHATKMILGPVATAPSTRRGLLRFTVQCCA
jgi:adenylate kinase family enzyme